MQYVQDPSSHATVADRGFESNAHSYTSFPDLALQRSAHTDAGQAPEQKSSPHLALPPDGSPGKAGQPPPQYIPPHVPQVVPQGLTVGTATTQSSSDFVPATDSPLRPPLEAVTRGSGLSPHVPPVDTFDMVHTVVPLPHPPPENAPIADKMGFLHRQLDEIGVDRTILNGLALLGGGGHQRLQGGAHRKSKDRVYVLFDPRS